MLDGSVLRQRARDRAKARPKRRAKWTAYTMPPRGGHADYLGRRISVRQRVNRAGWFIYLDSKEIASSMGGQTEAERFAEAYVEVLRDAGPELRSLRSTLTAGADYEIHVKGRKTSIVGEVFQIKEAGTLAVLKSGKYRYTIRDAQGRGLELGTAKGDRWRSITRLGPAQLHRGGRDPNLVAIAYKVGQVLAITLPGRSTPIVGRVTYVTRDGLGANFQPVASTPRSAKGVYTLRRVRQGHSDFIQIRKGAKGWIGSGRRPIQVAPGYAIEWRRSGPDWMGWDPDRKQLYNLIRGHRGPQVVGRRTPSGKVGTPRVRWRFTGWLVYVNPEGSGSMVGPVALFERIGAARKQIEAGRFHRATVIADTRWSPMDRDE